MRHARTRAERGASAVEYGLLIALFVAVLVGGVFALQEVVQLVFEQTACDEARGYACTKSE